MSNLTLKSTRVRLSLTYLAIIMALTLGFSVAFYYQSIWAADTGLSKQLQELRGNLYFVTSTGIEQIHATELRRFSDNLLAKLALFNACMFIVGAFASYLLARRSLRPLEEALTSQSRFTSDAAHELRTPLTAMKAEIEVAMRNKVLGAEEAREVLDSNLEEIAKLEQLTAALLRLAASSERTNRTYWQTYRLADIIQAAFKRLEEKAKNRKITVALPSTRQEIFGDPDQLIELFVTLLGNAIKYSHDGGAVKVSVRKKDTIVVINIKDSGIGISETDLPHVFERFYRADQSRTNSSALGYGLGLSLAEAIVKAHGGKITVKSVYQKGSTFSIYLPI